MEKSLGRQLVSRKILSGHPVNMHIVGVFSRTKMDLGKMHLWGTWLCSSCPEVFNKGWGRTGLAFAENKGCPQVALHGVGSGSSTEYIPSLEGHPFQCFGGDVPPIQKVSLQLCEVMLRSPGITHTRTLVFRSLGPMHHPLAMWGRWHHRCEVAARITER